MVLYFTAAERKTLQEILRDLNLTDHIDIVLIDARADNKPSGSKA